MLNLGQELFKSCKPFCPVFVLRGPRTGQGVPTRPNHTSFIALNVRAVMIIIDNP